MAIYAVGDIQGCVKPLENLLDQIQFDSEQDQIWLTGDLVNRGPHSLKTLRLVKSLGTSAITVLGNHDLHLLAIAAGVRKMRPEDSLKKILKASDSDELLHWVRHLPMAHADASIRTLMTHAGVYPLWSRKQVLKRAQEIETRLQGDDYRIFLRKMYGRRPTAWRKNMRGYRRARFITNALTRMRFCDHKGRLDFKQKGRPGFQNKRLIPWYQYPQRRCRKWRIVFGHWSALGFRRVDNIISLDSACLWGGTLTAVRLDPHQGADCWQVRCRKR